MLARWIAPIVGLLLVLPAVRGVEPDRMIPSDAEFVWSMRPKQVLDSALLKSQGWDLALKTLLSTNEMVQEILESTGVDPFRDVESVLVAARGQREKGRFVVVARGKFQPSKIAKAIEKQGKENGAPVKKTQEEGATLWELPTPAFSIYAGFIGKEAVVVSNVKEDIIECLTGGIRKEPSRELKTALERMTGREAAWMVGLVTAESRKEMRGPDAIREFAENVDSWSLTLDMTDAIAVAMNMHTPDGASATTLRKTIEDKFFPFVKNTNKNGPNGKKVESLLDVIKLETKGSSFGIKAKVDEDLLKKLMSN